MYESTKQLNNEQTYRYELAKTIRKQYLKILMK